MPAAKPRSREQNRGRPPAPPSTPFEQRLRRCMTKKRIGNYTELAALLGWPVLQVHRLKQGKEPTVGRALQLARALGTTVEHLFSEFGRRDSVSERT